VRYRFGTFELRVPERELLHDRRPVAIEPKVLDLLAYLVRHRDRAVGRDELISAVWGRLDVTDGTLAQAILRLRKTLGEAGGPKDPVRTVPRHGYRWVAPTESIDGGVAEDDAPAGYSGDSAKPAGLTAGVKAGENQARAGGERPVRRRLLTGMLIVVVLLGLFRLLTAPEAPNVVAQGAGSRLAILPLASTRAGEELEDAGMIELLRRHLVARPAAPDVLSTASAVSYMNTHRGKPRGGLAAMLHDLQVGHVLEVDLRHDESGYRLSGDLVSADTRSALEEVRADNLDDALERFADHVLVRLDANAATPGDSAIHGGDRLAEALRLAARGRIKDAYDLLSAAHASSPQQIDILVELAHLECTLELTKACDQHLDEALADPAIGAWSKASVHLERAARRQAELRLDDVRREIEAAAQAARATSDSLLEARIILARQHLAAAGDDGHAALDLARRALTLFRVAGDRGGQGLAQLALGDIAAQDGHYDEALSAYREAQALFDGDGDLAGVARAGARVARALGHLGRFGEAGVAARAAQAAASRQQDPVALRDALDSLAWSLLQSGQLGEAREAAHRGLALLDSANNPRQALRLQSLLGFIDAAGGRYRNAMVAWEDALQRMPDRGPGIGADSLRLAIVYAALNADDTHRAQLEASRLRADAEASADADVGSFADHADALLAAQRGQLDVAARLYSRVWAQARDTGTLNQQLLADYSDVLLKLGDLDAVESLLGEATLPDTEGHLVQLVRARYLLRRDRLDEAQAAFDAALRLAAERYSPLIDTTRDELARARSRQGKAAEVTTKNKDQI
jgi:DNA-binding winged helix-turn-helix (wHTH) protein/tetratricopeptide (TPR) repeat protein